MDHTFIIIFFKWKHTALTGVAQLVGHHCKKQKVNRLIPCQGTHLGYRFGPGQGVRGDPCFSPSLSPSLPLSLKINK